MKKKNTIVFHQQFPVLLEEDPEGGYVVSCPVFEGCYSQGETVERALKNIQEAIALCLEEQEEEKDQAASFPKIGLHLVDVAR